MENAQLTNTDWHSLYRALDNPFVEFCRDFMRHAEKMAQLKTMCLEHRWNMNLILFLLWFTQAQGGRLNQQHYQPLETSIHVWHQQVDGGLQNLLQDVTALENQSLVDEVEKELKLAERMEQSILYDAVFNLDFGGRSLRQRTMDAFCNLVMYIPVHIIAGNEALQTVLKNLVHYILPEAKSHQLDDYLARVLQNKLRRKQNLHEEQLNLGLHDAH